MEEQTKRYRRWSFIVLAVLSLVSCFWAYQITKMELDYDFEKFFPKGADETKFFKEHRNRFETDNDFVLIALENKAGVFDQDFLQKAKTLGDSLKKAKHVESVLSPLDMKFSIRAPLTGLPFTDNYLHLDSPQFYAGDSTRIWNSPDVLGNYFSKDGKSLTLVLQHTDYLSKTRCDTVALKVKSLVESHGFDGYHLAGRSIGQGYYVDLMGKELAIFVITSFILVVLFLSIAFRTLWGVIVPIIVVLLSVIWIMGIMRFTGKDVDVMLTVLPTIMFVVGMSDVVHILSKYLTELRAGRSKIESIKKAFKEVGAATFLTSLTTAIGFFTLISSGVTPIIDFGIYTGIGVFVAFGLAFTLLPAMMVLSKTPKIAEKNTVKQDFWYQRLHATLRWTLRNKKAVGVASILVIGICIFGISKIRINNFLLDDLSEDNYLKNEFRFFEESYGGVRPFEMTLSLKDSSKSMLDYEALTKIDTIEKWLEKKMELGFVLSPLTLLKIQNRANEGGGSQHFTLPSTERKYEKQVRKLSDKIFRSDTARMLITANLDTMRLSSRMPDMGSEEIRKRDAAFDAFMAESGLAAEFDYQITGTARLIDLNNSYLAENMLIGLLIAFGVIALIVGFLYRSLRMVIISLIPNMFPLLVVAAVMGFLDINLKVSTSIIFTIIFGIAVDDTIHFLSKLRFESLEGKSLFYAMKRTYLSTGKAIVVTSIILCGGFLTLIFSDFMGTFYIGFLLGMALFLAVIADLLLLPLLLILFYGKNVHLLPERKKKGKIVN